MANALKNLVKRWANKQRAGLGSDPDFFGKLDLLPNPNPVLRQMGKAEQVYASILNDAHVKGEVRSIRGAVRRMDYRLLIGDKDSNQAQAALDLCNEWMAVCNPNKFIDWHELMWQMTSSILNGFIVHELIWNNINGKLLPIQILDRPNHRFGFNANGELLLKTKANRNGELVKPYEFVVSQNMPTMANPYGDALLSNCFWPWTFKTGGFRYFVKYCERHGLPWPIAKYPQGTPEPEQDELAKALANMVENAYAVIPDGNSVELLTVNATGKLPQQSLIELCNREMSKALTGQAMVAEIQEVGARAASETAQNRQYSINDSDRDIAVSGMNQILRLITSLNFSEDVPSPRLEFYKNEQGGKERAETYEIATRIGNPSKKAFHQEMGIPVAEDNEDLLQSSAANKEFSFNPHTQDFKSNNNLSDVRITAVADEVISEHILDPIGDMMDSYRDCRKTTLKYVIIK